MALEYIEEGKKYKLELLCIHNKEKVIVFETPTGDHIPLRIADLECVSPENGIKNTETAPKYDPNRIFRKGDIVKMDTHGRNFSEELKKHGLKPCVRYTVTKDESADGHVAYTGDDGVEHLSMFFWLKLVTPVEELEPYYVKNIIRGYAVYEREAGDLAASCVFWSKYHPHAKAAAEAERDRLNAEYRKEQE